MPGEEMDYQFSEIRKSARGKMLGFAKDQGCAVDPAHLRHHLSLTAWSKGELAAAALCVERTPAQFAIEIISSEQTDDALVAELVDRCLRKMQARGIMSARLSGSSPASTKAVWQHAGWLEHIEETPPPEVAALKSQASQAVQAQVA